MELTQEQIDKLEKYTKFEESKDLAIFDELQQMNKTLKEIVDKPNIEIPPFPEIPETVVNVPETVVNVPQPKVEVKTEKIDLTKTNSLLQKLLDKKEEPLEVSVELHLK